MPESSTDIISLKDKSIVIEPSPLSSDKELHSVAAPFTEAELPPQNPKDVRFWFCFAGLLLSTFFATLEGYAISTALPTIVSDLQSDQFLWVPAAYAISSSAFLLLAGGLAQVFGRRPIILGSLLLFAIGSAICGAAQSMNMLIGGRVVQGTGAGGIFALTQIILSDLVTLKERGAYNGLFAMVWAIGGGLGPILGGSLSRHTVWRWIFYLNIPAAGLIIVILGFYLQLKTPLRRGTIFQTLAELDFYGNLFFIGALVACTIGLTWGGIQFPWSSSQVLAPLCVGVAGLAVWLFYELRYCNYPSVPLVVISQRTSLSGYIQNFIGTLINISLVYYLPVYYQACKDASPTASGVDVLALCIATGPTSLIAGLTITKTGRYRPQLWLGWCIVIIGLGLISTLTENTSRATSIGFQVIVGFGIGIIYSGAYFPVLAPLPVSLNANALAFFIFIRTFSFIWSATIGGVILQNKLRNHLPSAVQNSLPGSVNVAYAAIPLIPDLPQPARDVARHAYSEALATVWRVLIAFGGVGLLSSLAAKGLTLHTTRDLSRTLVEQKPHQAESA